MITLERVVDVIASKQFRYATEEELQQGLAAAIADAGLPVVREVRLSGRDRIDLLVDRVGVEVKVAGSGGEVARQCRRYLESDQLDALVLVTSRVRHLATDASLAGKPFRVVQLAGAGL